MPLEATIAAEVSEHEDTKGHPRMHDKIPISSTDPTTNVLLKLTANSIIDRAVELESGAPHTPEFHAEGWKIALETPRGVVGLWSCWLGNQFHLGYPGPAALLADDSRSVWWSDVAIRHQLQVQLASPVLQVDATGVRPGYEGEYKDADKPLEVCPDGRVVAYGTRGPRLWGNYCGARADDELGRVWVEHSNACSVSTEFRLVAPGDPRGFVVTTYGHGDGWGIRTVPFTFANRYAPDGPTSDPGRVQVYRDGFLRLACDLARALGGARAVHVDYGFVLTPAQLDQLGYGDVTWLRGSPDAYRGWGSELVVASRGLEGGAIEHVVLMSGNTLVPWATIRRVPVAGEATFQQLLDLLTF